MSNNSQKESQAWSTWSAARTLLSRRAAPVVSRNRGRAASLLTRGSHNNFMFAQTMEVNNPWAAAFKHKRGRGCRGKNHLSTVTRFKPGILICQGIKSREHQTEKAKKESRPLPGKVKPLVVCSEETAKHKTGKPRKKTRPSLQSWGDEGIFTTPHLGLH